VKAYNRKLEDVLENVDNLQKACRLDGEVLEHFKLKKGIDLEILKLMIEKAILRKD